MSNSEPSPNELRRWADSLRKIAGREEARAAALRLCTIEHSNSIDTFRQNKQLTKRADQHDKNARLLRKAAEKGGDDGKP